MQTEKIDLIHCDVETGICEIPQPSDKHTDDSSNKAVKLLYTLRIPSVLPVGA